MARMNADILTLLACVGMIGFSPDILGKKTSFDDLWLVDLVNKKNHDDLYAVKCDASGFIIGMVDSFVQVPLSTLSSHNSLASPRVCYHGRIGYRSIPNILPVCFSANVLLSCIFWHCYMAHDFTHVSACIYEYEILCKQVLAYAQNIS